MSILTELKKLTKKKNATVVSQALPDSLDGSGSGSGGDGANVLTLYAGEKNNTPWVYKDPECTQEYASYDEALATIKAASVVKIITVENDTQNLYYFPANANAFKGDLGSESVYVSIYAQNGLLNIYLWKVDGETA